MSQKLTLTYVNRQQRTTQAGKPYESLSIMAQEYNNTYLSGFGNAANKSWQVGQIVEVADVKRVEKNGKVYLNFEMPKPVSKESSASTPLLTEIRDLLRLVAVKMGALSLAAPKVDLGFDYPEAGQDGEINPDDIPF